MKIRKASEEDIQDIQVLIFRNVDEVMSKLHSKDVLEDIKTHSTIDSLSSQLQWKQVYVIEEDDQIVATGAFANFGTSEKPKYSVSNLFVVPELHRKGIGTLLMKQIIYDANEKEASDIHVPSSKTGINFYTQFGFEIDRDQPEANAEITWMTKKLKPSY